MKIFLNVLKLEIKKEIKAVPIYFVILAATLAVLSVGVFALGEYLKEEPQMKYKVGVSVDEEDDLSVFLIDSIQNSEGIKKICTFETFNDEKRVYEGLENDEYKCGVILSTNFLQQVLDSKDAVCKVLFSEKESLERNIVYELFSCGESYISIAQGAIYAFIDYYGLAGFNWREFKAYVKEINMLFIDFIFPRYKLFFEEYIYSTGKLSVTEYYLCYALILYLFISGMISSGIFKRNDEGVWKKLEVYGIGEFKRSFIKWVTSLIVTTAVNVPFVIVCFWFFNKLELVYVDFNLYMILTVFAAVFIINSIIFLCYGISKSIVSGTVLLFVLGLLLVFLSGGMIPLPFLPSIFGKITVFLPVGYIAEGLGGIFSRSEEYGVLINMLLCGGCTFLAAMLAVKVNNLRK